MSVPQQTRLDRAREFAMNPLTMWLNQIGALGQWVNEPMAQAQPAPVAALPVQDAAPVAPTMPQPAPVAPAPVQDEMMQTLAATQGVPSAVPPPQPAAPAQPQQQAPAAVNVNVGSSPAQEESQMRAAMNQGAAGGGAPGVAPATTSATAPATIGMGGYGTLSTQPDLFELLADDPASAFYRALGGNPSAALAMDRNFMTKRAVGRYDDAIEPLSLIMSIMGGGPVNPVEIASSLLGRGGQRLDIGSVVNSVLQGALGGNQMASEALSQVGMNNVMALLGLAQSQRGMLPGYVQARQNIAARELLGLRNQQYDRGPSTEDDTLEWARVVARLAGV